MNHRGSLLLRASVAIAVVTQLVAAQGPESTKPAADYQLSVGGEVAHELKLGPAELSKLPRRSVKAIDHGGAEATFEGVAVIDVLELAGLKFGDGLRGSH